MNSIAARLELRLTVSKPTSRLSISELVMRAPIIAYPSSAFGEDAGIVFRQVAFEAADAVAKIDQLGCRQGDLTGERGWHLGRASAASLACLGQLDDHPALVRRVAAAADQLLLLQAFQ